MDTLGVRLYGIFPSDEWIKLHFRKKHGPIWFRILTNTFLGNMMFYVSPMMGMSDVGLSQGLESGALRTSYNPIRWLIGFPVVASYIHALRQGVSNKEVREGMWSLVMGPALTAVNRLHDGMYHETRVRLVRDGRLNTLIFEKDHRNDVVHWWDEQGDRELVTELRAFIKFDYHIAEDDWWMYVIEEGDIYMELIPGRKHPYTLMAEKFKRENPDWVQATSDD